MRTSRSRLSLTLACLLIHGAARADRPWKTSCQRAREVALPAQDQPDEAARKALEGCKSEELFYGIGRPADPDRARLCAYAERAAGDQVVFGGSAMLMTVYATGVGGRRNLPLAIRFACDLDGAPAEMEHRIAHLEGLGAGAPDAGSGAGASFDLCDDATSGFLQGHCAAHTERIERARRAQRHRALSVAWTPREHAAFDRLRAAADAFFQARTGGEVDLGGSARAALQIEEGARLEALFDAVLGALERDTLPRAAPGDLARADRELNELYRRILKLEDPVSGTVTRDGIRQAERKWVKYRDGWAAMARLIYPRADRDGLKTLLTRQRGAMLRDLVAATPPPPR